MAQSFKALVQLTCANADALQANVDALIVHAKKTPYVDYRNQAAKAIGEHYGVKPHESQIHKGQLTFAKDTAAEQKLSRICSLHPKRPMKSGKREAVAVPAKVVKTIRAEIIAAGLTKKQLDQLIKEIRDSISFA
jgi:hypothetical protein